MKRFLSIAAAAGLSCTLVASGSAQAAIIDFENVDTSGAPFAPLLSDRDYVTQDGYFFQGQDPLNNSGIPDFALVAGMVNGADAGSCLDGQCPAGNATNYIGAFNGSVIGFGRLSGADTTLARFDAAFLAAADAAPTGLPAYLAIEADRADGSFAVGVFALGAVGADGTTAFQTFQAADANIILGDGTLTSGDVVELYAYAYYCDKSGTCSAFTSNQGQFALDNVVLDENGSAAPETATWAMMLAGFGAIGTALRRRRQGLSQAA